jgi:hypothetical protein
MGTGIMLVLATVTLLEEEAEAEELSVVAAAPVTARTTTKARMMFFMIHTPKVVFTCKDFAGHLRLPNHKMV